MARPLLLLLLAACAPRSEPGAAEPSGGEPTSDTAPVDTAALVPLVDEALLAGCGEPDPGRVAPVGDDLHRITLGAPEAVCNDGSHAVIFVRAATDPAHLADWALYLEGGGWCGDHASCRARWCGLSYDAGKMSSRWAPETIGADGLASSDPSNAFAGWNQVFVYYCSSDLWTGQRSDAVLDPAVGLGASAPTSPVGAPFRAHFRGADIVRAALDRLDAAPASDDGAEQLPALVDAERILFTGSSAGGYGATHHLDDVAARYPEALVRGLVDSMTYVHPELFDPAVAAKIAGGLQQQHDYTFQVLYDGYVDGSCLAAHPDPDDAACVDLGRVQREHVATPFLLVHDLYDPVLDDYYVDAGAIPAEYAAAGHAMLSEWAVARPELALRASACARHTTLESDAWFQGSSVADEAGTGWSVEDAALALLDDMPIVAVDTPDGAASVCSAPAPPPGPTQ